MKLLFWIIVICGLGSMWLYYERADYDPEAVAREALVEINDYRVEKGQAELVWDDSLAILAMEHSQRMKDTGDYNHSNHPFPYCENILKGGHFPDGDSVVGYWKESEAHNIIMTSRSITKGAVGISEGFWGASYATFMGR